MLKNYVENFKACWKPCWKLQGILKTVSKISSCVENCFENFKACWKFQGMLKNVANFKVCWKLCWKFQGVLKMCWKFHNSKVQKNFSGCIEIELTIPFSAKFYTFFWDGTYCIYVTVFWTYQWEAFLGKTTRLPISLILSCVVVDNCMRPSVPLGPRPGCHRFFPPNAHTHHQVLLVVTSHHPCTISHLNLHIKADPT